MSTKKQPLTCQFLIDETVSAGSKSAPEAKRSQRRCGAPVPIEELPADPYWPVLCRDHLRTYTSPILAPEKKP